MERLDLESDGLETCVKQAADVLKNGGVILYPTDTLYGLGADAFSDPAVNKVYEIKGREAGKPVHAVVADIDMAKEYADLENDAYLLAQEFLPGALTLIVKKKKPLEKGIVRGIDTFGFRIPDHDFCLHLAALYAKPFTATSANISGLQPGRNVDAILEQLGAGAQIIDLIIDAGELKPAAPSTVVDLAHDEPTIVREGAIPVEDIWDVVRESWQ